MPHRKVSGHFEGTGVKFTIYLPPKSKWEGRFFQLVYPTQDENASAQTIGFGADSGAYTVHVKGTQGYRADAAAAKFAKTVAARYYNAPDRRIYGYIYGGSGGSFQTVGAIENTTGVWDGAVPIIQGVPVSIPNDFAVRALARLVLRDKAPQIADAVRPGGSGDPYAGLNAVQRAMLREVTSMGVPLRAWEDYSYVLGLNDPQGLMGIGAIVRGMDPTYADDFWSRPGYLGTEKSALGDLIRAARTDHLATITKVERNAQNAPTGLVLDGTPSNPDPAGLDFTVYAADGTTKIGTLSGTLDRGAKVFTLDSGNAAEVLDALDEGARLRIDNRWFIALHAYYRHQVPKRAGFYGFDQFRDADGQPLHPQRNLEVGRLVSASTSGGGTHTGQITGKVIVVDNLLDSDAFPWHADWYRTQVKQALGARFDDNYRLWYNDNADHQFTPADGEKASRLIDFTGIYQQALRDVSAWAEKGTAPPRSTGYDVADSQIKVPKNAAARRGIQPVIDLTAGGRTRIEVPAGKAVTFRARIQLPPKTGEVVATEWDFTGTGAFTARSFGAPRQTVEVKVTFTYTKPGTYYPALRATAQREGDPSDPFTEVPNLGRMRVVVR
ncbi:PKD domain-containing protein [Actinocorallia populi]|uniref:PKD domain-containing protein n=1 Tax=Actinocorallia populi TaxID=2079200 RepID=UPI0018E5196C|nr:PKD domain-containing protein [Actinocorallia populi]